MTEVAENLPLEQIEEGLLKVSQAFSPAAPVNHRDLFAGRTRQLFRVVDVIGQVGQHAAIYGERGVGKTSLAKVGSADVRFPTVHYTCHSGDDFVMIWREVLTDLTFSARTTGVGFIGEDGVARQSLAEIAGLHHGVEASPSDVKRALQFAATAQPVVIIDEFDQVEDDATKTLMADTIKILSDQGIAATIVIVGVGSTIEDLIREHASIERCLVQIQMPKMRPTELREIVTRGMEKCDLEVSEAFADRVARMSNGLPHYTHLLGQHAARRAVEMGRSAVTLEHLREAIDLATEDVSRSVVTTYANATRQGSKPTHWDHVLTACAMATKDELGRFGTPQVRDALDVLRHPLGIPNFTPHLNEFASEGQRGGVLTKEGKPGGRQLYEFRNPLLTPYVLMKAYTKGILTDDIAERL